ncbi:MAG: hypothetical protein R3C03_11605 [Pirellulaceae bacterium]
MSTPQFNLRLCLAVAILCLFPKADLFAQIRLPAIDPSGNRIFLPGGQTTSLLGPFSGSNGLFSHHRNTNDAVPPTRSSFWSHQTSSATPSEPAFTHPPAIPKCTDPNNPNCGRGQHLIPRPSLFEAKGNPGQIILTPSRIIAPVGSEVVALAGICGGDGTFQLNQPLEWMLSNDSVGQIIEVGGMEHPNFNRLVPPSSQKFDGQYAWGRTGLKEKTITRGTPTPCDDIEVLKGQTYISLSSASPGTTYLTAVAPNATGWDRRRATTIIHWVDGIWSIPTPVKTTSGTVQPLTTTVSRVSDNSGIENWKVRYTIVDGVPAEFVPTGSQQAELTTNTDGQATVQVRQQAGDVQPGMTTIRVDVIRPSMLGEQELLVESGVTSITWSAPALTIVNKGPNAAAKDSAFNYRIEINNPGDQTARGVIVKTDSLGDDVQFISSSPKPAIYGKTLQWELGDIPPGTVPRVIDVQMKSDTRGMKRLCFEVSSESDQLKTVACSETEIAAPCLGLKIDGPTSGVVGSQAAYNIEIMNQCDEPLENVTIDVAYDVGLSNPGMGNTITANLGSLAFGEKKTVPLIFDLIRPGAQCFTLNITSDGGHTAGARRCIEISQAAVGTATIRVDGDRLTTLNNTVLAKARIQNNGNVPLNNVRVINKYASSLQPVAATQGISAEFLGNELIFSIGRIDPGQEVIIDVQYQATEADGNAFSQFSIVDPVQAEDRLPIRIEPLGGSVLANQPANNSGTGDSGGVRIPNDNLGTLSVSTASKSGPLPADNQSRHRVDFEVANGSGQGVRNVRVKVLIPPGTQAVAFQSLNAPLQYDISPDGSEINVEPIQVLRANEAIQFGIEMVGLAPGSYTFEVQATSDDVIGVSRDSVVMEYR